MTTQNRLHVIRYRCATWERSKTFPAVSRDMAATTGMGGVVPAGSGFVGFHALLSLLLFGILLWPGCGLAGSPDWGTGFYRLNPAKEPAFSSESNRTLEPRRTDREDRFQEPPPRSDPRRAPPREWPDDSVGGERSRYDNRPWGEVPPEWRNEDLNRRAPADDYAPVRPPARYYDAPEESPWSASEGAVRGERNSWDYPYPPEREYRRRDSRSSYPYYEDRVGERVYRRRPPPYYYDGGNGWWDAP
ncbi:MAG: hypothetical protein HQL90_10795 [Magnetococcales bacterium]|nr:hypothetical protein [Magnetococcales bacterium]